MDIYINKIRDILIDCMPKYWYKAYLYFDSTETGSMTSAEYYVKTPAGSIISYGDLLYNCSTEKVNSIKAGTSEILTYVRLLHEASTESGRGEQCIFHVMIMSHIVNFIMIL